MLSRIAAEERVELLPGSHCATPHLHCSNVAGSSPRRTAPLFSPFFFFLFFFTSAACSLSFSFFFFFSPLVPPAFFSPFFSLLFSFQLLLLLFSLALFSAVFFFSPAAQTIKGKKHILQVVAANLSIKPRVNFI